jgi:two-component system sensor histidine kinase/response regulator
VFSLPRTRLLLVDDQPLVGDAVRRLLAAEPEVEFSFCADAHLALEVADRFILSSSGFMLRLLENLLDVSQIEAGELRLDRRPTDLAAVVARNVDLNRVVAAAKQIEVRLRADRMEQVLNNLVSNAVKFSRPGTAVEVRVERRAGEVVLSVADQGEGIPPDEVDRLFKRFSRTSVRATGGEKSTGLGLVIAKQVVDGHGGRIWVESVVGEGSTFSVALPH